MNPEKILMRFHRVAGKWSDALQNYSEEQLCMKPGDGGWTLGQVYVHLLLASEHYFLKNAAACLEGRGEKKMGGKRGNWFFMRLIGGFPPVRFRMPRKIAVEPRQPENIPALSEKLNRTLSSMRDICRRFSESDSRFKTHHPLFGYLNACEWCWLNEKHFRHHLLQKKRLDRFIRAQALSNSSILSA